MTDNYVIFETGRGRTAARKTACTKVVVDLPRKLLLLAARKARPIYIRLPGQGEGDDGHCPITGLSRAMLVALAVPGRANGGRPPVRSRKVRMPGCRKGGVRLIELDSLLEYLDRWGPEGDDLVAAPAATSAANGAQGVPAPGFSYSETMEVSR